MPEESTLNRYINVLTEAKKSGGRTWKVYRAAAEKKAKADPDMREALAWVEQADRTARTTASVEQGVRAAMKRGY